MKILFGDIIKFAQMALGLIPEILYPIDVVITVCK